MRRRLSASSDTSPSSWQTFTRIASFAWNPSAKNSARCARVDKTSVTSHLKRTTSWVIFLSKSNATLRLPTSWSPLPMVPLLQIELVIWQNPSQLSYCRTERCVQRRATWRLWLRLRRRALVLHKPRQLKLVTSRYRWASNSWSSSTACSRISTILIHRMVSDKPLKSERGITSRSSPCHEISKFNNTTVSSFYAILWQLNQVNWSTFAVALYLSKLDQTSLYHNSGSRREHTGQMKVMVTPIL